MFSVIIPLYNKIHFVERAVESVLSQDFKEFELIIVDDGSTDGGGDLIKEKFSDERIRLIRQENRGVSAARNKGISESKFPFIAFLDADDYWINHYLGSMKELIENFPDAGLYGVGYYDETGGVDRYSKRWVADGYKGYVENYFENALSHYLFSSSSSVVRSSCFLKIGSFDERISSGEDLDVWFRLILDSKAVFFNQPFVYYTGDDEKASTKKLPSFKRHLVYYVVEKYYHEKLSGSSKDFFDRYLLINLRPYYISNIDNLRVHELLTHIDYKNKFLRYNLIYALPKPMIALIYGMVKFIKKIYK